MTTPASTEFRSYTDSSKGGFARFARDRWMQYRAIRRSFADVSSAVDARVQDVERLVTLITDDLGLELRGLRVLEIGHGPLPLTLAYLSARGCLVTGIDLNVVPQKPKLRQWLRVWQLNGVQQFAKAVGRELLGVNPALRREFTRRVGLSRFPTLDLQQMDVASLAFPDNSFDLVYSRVVFEHIRDPETALKHIVRVVRPGGGVHLTFCHHGWYNGLEDLRVICRAPDAPPPWAHLRPRYAHLVRPGAYTNQFRIDDWRRLFAKVAPRATIEAPPLQDPAFKQELARARAEGGLSGYTDEELLSDILVATWNE